MSDIEFLVRVLQDEAQRELEERQLARLAPRPPSPFGSTALRVSRSLIKLGTWLDRQGRIGSDRNPHTDSDSNVKSGGQLLSGITE